MPQKIVINTRILDSVDIETWLHAASNKIGR